MKNQKKDERHWPSKAAQGSAKGECIRASYIYAIDSSNRGSHVAMDAFTRSQVSLSLSLSLSLSISCEHERENNRFSWYPRNATLVLGLIHWDRDNERERKREFLVDAW